MESESTSKDPPLPVADLKDFKWTPTLEKTLLFNMINLKPSGKCSRYLFILCVGIRKFMIYNICNGYVHYS